MSESYEAVIGKAPEELALSAFRALETPLQLRMLRLADGVYGLCRVADLGTRFDPQGVERVAAQFSATVGRAAAVFYDSSCAVRAGALFEAGERRREFGESDEYWAPLSGHRSPSALRLRAAELRSDVEYECVLSAIDVALAAIGVEGLRSTDLTQAFCYREPACIASR